MMPSGIILFVGIALQMTSQPSPPRAKVAQAHLNALSDACRSPREWLTLNGEGVTFSPSPDAEFATLECVLEKVSAVVPASNIAFIGNEQLSEEK